MILKVNSKQMRKKLVFLMLTLKLIKLQRIWEISKEIFVFVSEGISRDD